MLFKCIAVFLLAHVVLARTTGGTSENSIHETARSEGATVFGDIRYMYKVYQECAATDLTSCLKLKLVAALDRAARAYSEIPLFQGVSFVKDPNASIQEVVKTEAELEASLPRALEDREDALDNLISNRVSDFLQSHTLKVNKNIKAILNGLFCKIKSIL